MKLEITSISLTGDRENNEDYANFVSTGEGAVLVVADGLGGKEFGELASEAFTKGILAQHQQLLAGDYSSRENAKVVFQAAFVQGAEFLHKVIRADNATANPQTTVVMAVITERAIGIAHIGDSRAYRLSRSGADWRSLDHSLVELLVHEGEITEAEMGTHPDQGKLIKSIGMDAPPAPSVTVLSPLLEEEAVLLCSDGFWEQLLPEEMASLASAHDLQGCLTELTHTAIGRAAGKSDNVTALCVRLNTGGLAGTISRWLS